MTPRRGLLGWLEDRTGWSGPLRKLLRYPVPEHAHRNPMFSLGSLTVVLFMVQAVTGMLLAFYYELSPEGAYQSTDFIQYELPMGWLVRGIHHWGASMMVLVVVLHMLRVYLYGAYKRPRELTWIFGVVMLLIVVSFGFTGHLLPWDQKAYWATKIGTNMAGTVPFVGEWLMRFMRGGGQEPGETLHDALRRECLEEIGVNIEIHDIIFVRDYLSGNHEFADDDPDTHQVEVMFACTLAGGERPRVGIAPDTDQLGVEWLELAQLHQHRIYPKVLTRLLKDGTPSGPARYLGDVN